MAWRDPFCILAVFAGIAALGLMLLQPLLAGGYLPGLPAPRGRSAHRCNGMGIVLTAVEHAGGLWVTSPPDMIDALPFVSPTRFSDWR